MPSVNDILNTLFGPVPAPPAPLTPDPAGVRSPHFLLDAMMRRRGVYAEAVPPGTYHWLVEPTVRRDAELDTLIGRFRR